MDIRPPRLVAHADWGTSPEKRWCAIAVLEAEGRYRVDATEPVGNTDSYFSRLRKRVGGDDMLLCGFDFPIGLPAGYAERAGLVEFRAALSGFGSDRWSDFFNPASRRSDISLTRPFYPERSRGSKKKALIEGMGLNCDDDLYRPLRSGLRDVTPPKLSSGS